MKNTPIRTKGAIGKELAVSLLENAGHYPYFAKSGDPYDVVCQIGDKTYAIIVKHGKLVNINIWKFKSMIGDGFIPAIMMIDDQYKYMFLTHNNIITRGNTDGTKNTERN